MGIVVELLRRDSTLAARVFTGPRGTYSISAVVPGRYALKAAGNALIPMVKQNLRVESETIVNLTMSSLYDLTQWSRLPQREHTGNAEDWAWTLRSSQSRPLLRWQEDGSPLLVWDGSAETRRVSQARRGVRVSVAGGGSRFGVAGEAISVEMERQNSARRRMAMSLDGDTGGAGLGLGGGLIEAMAGYRQEMAETGMGSGSIQMLGAAMAAPAVRGGGGQGLEVASLRTWESMTLMGGLEAEAGSEQVLARVGEGRRVMAVLPFARVTVHRGQSSIEYRLATARTGDPAGPESMAQAWLPVLSGLDGKLRLERGLHQELGWSTTAGATLVKVAVFDDDIENPMIEGAGRPGGDVPGAMLTDGASGLVRTSGPGYSSAGMTATVETGMAGRCRVRLSYANGGALVMHADPRPAEAAVMVRNARPKRAQMYSLALSGVVDGTGTKWKAGYRWQPDSTVTEVAPFSTDGGDPYMNVSVRQPIRLTGARGESPVGLEAQLDLRNLLAEGYQEFITSDGARLYFAQAQRSVRGGLAFTF